MAAIPAAVGPAKPARPAAKALILISQLASPRNTVGLVTEPRFSLVLTDGLFKRRPLPRAHARCIS
eukprot:2272168-Prymnesium_polylepis.1